MGAREVKDAFAQLVGRTLYLAFGAAVALFVMAHLFGKLDDLFGGSQDRATTAASQAQLDGHAGVVRLIATFQRVEIAKTAEARRLLRIVDSLQTHPRVMVIPPDNTAATYWKAQADSERTRADSAVLAARTCLVAAKACALRADTAGGEGAALHGQLTQQVKVKNHPCGLTAGVGAAAGKGSGIGLAVLLGCQL